MEEVESKLGLEEWCPVWAPRLLWKETLRWGSRCQMFLKDPRCEGKERQEQDWTEEVAPYADPVRLQEGALDPTLLLWRLRAPAPSVPEFGLLWKGHDLGKVAV